MSNGGYKGASPARETSPEQYPGVWELTEQFQAQADGNWPFQADDNAPKSLRFNSADSAYLSKAPAAAGNRRTWTWSGWVKVAKNTRNWLFSCSEVVASAIEIYSDGDLYVYHGDSGSYVGTTAVFRDFSAWYSFVVTYDTSQATAADRIRLYVNGVQTALDVGTQPTLNWDSTNGINSTNTHRIGHYWSGSSLYLNCSLADVHFIDGQALSCEEFGFFDGQGIWQPKRFTGDYSSGPVYTNDLDYTAAYSGYPLSNIFDGDPNSQWLTAAQAQLVTFTPSKPITFNDTLKIKFGGASHSVIYNGTTVTSDSGAGVYTVVSSGGGTLTSLAFQEINAGNLTAVYYIEVDGQILVDASVGRNSFHLDFSDGFNDRSGLGNNWTGNNVAPSFNLDISTSLELYVQQAGSGQSVLVNGKDVTSQVTTGQWSTITGVGNTLHSIEATGDGAGNNYKALTAVKVNGSWLIDTGVTNPPTPNIIGNWSSEYLYNENYGSRPVEKAFDGVLGSYVNAFSGKVGDESVSVDSPVNGNEASTGAGGERRGNYATLNPLISLTNITLSNGNLKYASAATYTSAFSSIGMTSGKWYFEGEVVAVGTDLTLGISADLNAANYVGGTATSYGYEGAYGTGKYNNASYVATGYVGYGVGDIISCAFDADNGKVYFAKNGTWQESGDPANGTNPAFSNLTASPYFFGVSNGNGGSWTVNFGQRSFYYAPPSGYSPLATSFLPEPTIKRGDEAMDVALWTGNNSTNKIGNFRLSPDLVWIKARNPYTLNHELYDTVRGAGNLLRSNTAGTEDSATRFSSFDSDGFTLNGSQPVNGLNETHVGWVWDAGDSTTTIAAGGLNSSAYDQSDTWSSYLTTEISGSSGVDNPTQAFDGVLGNTSSTSAGSSNTGTKGGLVWQPTNPYPVNNTIRVYGGSASDVYEVDFGSGYTNATSVSSGQWATIYQGSGNLVKIRSKDPSSGNASRIGAIEIDGKQLVDSGVSVTNVPLVATDVRARTDAGFSIAKWSKSANNQSYAHGLSQTPEFIIAKSLDGAHSWRVWHKDLANNKNILLDTSNEGQTTYTDMIGIPDANKVPLIQGGPGSTNGGMIAYNYHSVEGYCKVGSWSTDSEAFVFTGFRPKFLFYRYRGHAGNWAMFDTERDTNNPVGPYLFANSAAVEASADNFDFLSNGFKLKTSLPTGRTVVYICFAEHPFASNCRAR